MYQALWYAVQVEDELKMALPLILEVLLFS